MTISTHVLDTSLGRPAAGVPVRLQRRDGSTWTDVAEQTTNDDGRVAALLPPDATFGPGTFRVTFDVGSYFARQGVKAFYLTVVIEFVVSDAAQHYHVPLLLNPYGYSTYRGS